MGATALLASLVSTKTESVQIALCHLFFNIFGMLIWYPVPFMRQIPLNAATNLGAMTRRYRATPLFYIFFAFVLVPMVLLGASSLYELGSAYRVLGVMLTVALVAALSYVVFWWHKQDGREKTYSFIEGRQARSEAVKVLPNSLASLEQRLDALEKASSAPA